MMNGMDASELPFQTTNISEEITVSPLRNLAFQALKSPKALQLYVASRNHQTTTKQQYPESLVNNFEETVELRHRLIETEEKVDKLTKQLEEADSLRRAEVSSAEEKLRKHDEAAKRAIQQYQADVTAKLNGVSTLIT